jgi:hypothetical protein
VVGATVTSLAIATTAYLYPSGAAARPSAASPATATASLFAGGDNAPSEPPSPSPSATPSRTPTVSRTTTAPKPVATTTAPQQWRYATTGGARSGSAGRLLRYKVATELASGQNADAFAAHVQATFDNTRGWTRSGQWSFQRVTTDPADFTIWLATPTTTDAICARYGLATGGVVSCRGGPNVVINLVRWTQGIPAYANVSDYDHLVINHEVGHFLGFGHVNCPGPGQPAPVMQSQYNGLNGCMPNIWPYSDDGTIITGPPVPA